MSSSLTEIERLMRIIEDQSAIIKHQYQRILEVEQVNRRLQEALRVNGNLPPSAKYDDSNLIALERSMSTCSVSNAGSKYDFAFDNIPRASKPVVNPYSKAMRREHRDKRVKVFADQEDWVDYFEAEKNAQDANSR